MRTGWVVAASARIWESRAEASYGHRIVTSRPVNAALIEET
jgi:hypothetical protein